MVRSSCLTLTPLLLHPDVERTGRRRFILQPIWTKCTGFLDVVERAWHCPLQNAITFECLDWLLRITSRILKRWSDRLIGNIRIQLAIAREVIERLESAGDHRPLAAHKVTLHGELKLKMLGLSSLQMTIFSGSKKVMRQPPSSMPMLTCTTGAIIFGCYGTTTKSSSRRMTK
jgi:hypothetical protein